MSLKNKLHPSRYPNASGKMKTIIAFLIDINDQVTRGDVIEELHVTSDGLLMARHRNEVGAEMVGTYADLDRNWNDLIHATPDLTPDEAHDAEELLKTRITHWGLSDPTIEEEGVQA